MKFWITICAILICGPAAALSCLQPNIAEAFNRFDAAPESYAIAVGRVSVPKSGIPGYREGKPRRASGQFVGRYLGRFGLGVEVRQKISVQTQCVAHWCGGFPGGDQVMIMFLRLGKGARVLDMPACPSGGFVPETPKALELMQRCLKRGRCTKAEEAAWRRR